MDVMPRLVWPSWRWMTISGRGLGIPRLPVLVHLSSERARAKRCAPGLLLCQKAGVSPCAWSSSFPVVRPPARGTFAVRRTREREAASRARGRSRGDRAPEIASPASLERPLDQPLELAERRLREVGCGLRATYPSASRSSAMISSAAAVSGPDAIRAHHLVVLVLEDVAVPDEQAGAVEERLHARDLAGVGDHGVLATELPALGRTGDAVERLAVFYLEGDLVDVDRVGVLGEVVELPDLDRADLGELAWRLVPAEWVAATVGVECAEVGLGGAERLAAGAVEDDAPILGADLHGRGVQLVER